MCPPDGRAMVANQLQAAGFALAFRYFATIALKSGQFMCYKTGQF
jgi:hypothetical protein